LNAKCTRLETQLEDAKREALKATQAVSAVAELKRQLTPLHKALLSLFGEMGGIDTGAAREDSGSTQGMPKVWQAWKDKFGGDSYSARFIDALLEQKELNVPQLRAYMRCGINTVYQTATKLNSLGLLTKNGGKYLLRSL
jgi:hypothetical protein